MYLSKIVLTTNTFAKTDVFDNLLFRFKCNTIDSIAYNQGGGVDINTKIATLGDWNGDGMAELMWTKELPGSYVQISFGKRGEGHVLTRDVSFPLTGTALKTPKLLGDVNNDGYNDLGFVSYSLTGGSLILLGGPTPVISRRYTDSYHRHMGQVGDINGDGIDDFAAGEYHGNGGGEWLPKIRMGGTSLLYDLVGRHHSNKSKWDRGRGTP